MWVQGLGRGWAAVQCAAVQSDYAVKACRGSEALGNRGAMMCAGLQNRVGGIDFVWVCALVHTGVPAGQVLGGTDGETDGLCCRCGGPGLLSTQEGQSTRSEVR